MNQLLVYDSHATAKFINVTNYFQQDILKFAHIPAKTSLNLALREKHLKAKCNLADNSKFLPSSGCVRYSEQEITPEIVIHSLLCTPKESSNAYTFALTFS